MQHGFIKAAVATPNIKVADCEYNAEKIVELLKKADGLAAQLLVLPELCITGYTCSDLFFQQPLLEGAVSALFTIAEQSRGISTVLVVGLPILKDGKLYNVAAVLYNGKILGFVPKSHLPNYSEFYELRHFTPAPAENGVVEANGTTYPFGTKLLFSCKGMSSFCLGIEICEDLWVPCPPSSGHALAGATLIANLSASDETIGKDSYRRNLVTSQSGRLVCGYLYADAGEGESTTDLVFSSHSLIAENGAVLSETPPFTQSFACSEIDVERLCNERRKMNTFSPVKNEGYETVYFEMPVRNISLTRTVAMQPFVPGNPEEREARCESILSMQSYGLKKRLLHANSKTAVLGISGGLDSCLALLVCVRAMDLLHRPHTDIVAVTMPCFGTTARTKSNAEKLCEALGVTFRCIDITAAVNQHFQDTGHDPRNHDVTFENCQARERTQVLMDIANQTGGLVIGTGDLSELALGWATYNGDHMSMYGVNASVPKTLIRHMVRYSADIAKDENLRKVLLDILDTPVSPELLPAENGEISQKTEDIVGPYELHDFFLYYVMRFGFSPEKIYYLAKYAFAGTYEDAFIKKWLVSFYKRFFAHQFKRSCLPDGPKVGSVTLSPRGDWRMPSDASAALWLNRAENL